MSSPGATSLPQRAGVPKRAVIPLVGFVVLAWMVMIVSPMAHALHGFLASWFVMSVAMMVPSIYRPLRRVARDRVSRMWGFTAGYLLVWGLAGVPAYVALVIIPSSTLAVALLWLLVGVYLQVPTVLASFSACKCIPTNTPAVSAGLRQGIHCLIGCWPVMTMTMATLMVMHAEAVIAVTVMIGLTLLMIWQKQPGRTDAALRKLAVAVIIGAALVGVMGGQSPHLHVG